MSTVDVQLENVADVLVDVEQPSTSAAAQQQQQQQQQQHNNVGFMRSLPCGAIAGLAVDLSLFPIDTVKTRLQSHAGFKKSGGFSKIYAGVPSVAIGAAPGAALFFCSYETTKILFAEKFAKVPNPVAHMTGACIGEIVACLVRVPTELVKQRSQAFPNRSVSFVFNHIWKTRGFVGYFQGYFITVAREIPFSLIQFPLWELCKVQLNGFSGGPDQINPLLSAACGSLSGAIAAAVTTPLDVVKTRVMLTERLQGAGATSMRTVFKDVYRHEGLKGLYSGTIPRTLWMALGGFFFFGAYETALKLSYALRPKPFDGRNFGPRPTYDARESPPTQQPEPEEQQLSLLLRYRGDHFAPKPKSLMFDEKNAAVVEEIKEQRQEFVEKLNKRLQREAKEVEELRRRFEERKRGGAQK